MTTPQDSSYLEPFALMIGINKYQSSQVRPLLGAVEDMSRFAKFLVDHLAVKNLIRLSDERATRSAIIAALVEISKDPRIQFGAPIVIYYAGHGASAQKPPSWDQSGDKTIQAIVPYDFGPNCHVIPDRTLGALIQNIALAKGDNITVFFDSCHSGSGLRGGEPGVRVREISLDIENATLPDGLDRDILQRAVGNVLPHKLGSGSSHVLLSACRKDEFAREQGNKGRFTTALLKTLGEVNLRTTTYPQLIGRLSSISNQSPQCEGHNKNRFLFQTVHSNRSWHGLEKLKTSDAYLIHCGEAHGIIPRSRIAVHVGDEQRGVLIAKTVYPTKTEVYRPEFDIEDCVAHRGAVMEILDFGALSVAVTPHRIAPQTPVSRSILLRNAVSQLQGMTLETADANAQLRLVPTANPIIFEINCHKLGLTEIPHPWQRVGDVPLCESPEWSQVSAIIRSAAKYCWHLGRRSSKEVIGRNLTLDIRQVRWDSDDLLDLVAQPVGDNLYKAGELLDIVSDPDVYYGLKITNKSKRELFVGAFAFQSDLSIVCVYESNLAQGQADYCLSGDQSLSVGYDPGSSPLVFSFDPTNSSSPTYDFCCLKIFVSVEPLKLDILQNSPFGADFSDVPVGVRAMGKVDPFKKPSLQFWESISVSVLSRPPP